MTSRVHPLVVNLGRPLRFNTRQTHSRLQSSKHLAITKAQMSRLLPTPPLDHSQVNDITEEMEANEHVQRVSLR